MEISQLRFGVALGAIFRFIGPVLSKKDVAFGLFVLVMFLEKKVGREN